MKQNRLGCLSIVLFLALGFSLFLNFLLVVGKGTPTLKDQVRKFAEETVLPASGEHSGKDAKIALIYLRGIISSAGPGTIGESQVDDMKLQLRQAAVDDKVKAVVLYVDSPGGEVTASDSIYEAVRKVRDEAKKPVVVYMGSVAASGGYYVACGGSHIMANETTLTGSIGVIAQTLNYKEAMNKLGLDMITFKSGKFKDVLSGSRAMTEEDREFIQAMIMQTYDRFVGIVARERKQEEAALRTGLADGRIISGKDAAAAKLIDSLGEVEAAYAKAMELSGAQGATVVRYETPFPLAKLFKMLGADRSSKVEVNLTSGLLPKLEAGRLYYLPSHYAP